VETITSLITHQIEFTADAMADGWNKALSILGKKAMADARPEIERAALAVFTLPAYFNSQGLEGVADGSLMVPTKKLWGELYGIAMVFLPLVAVVNMASVYTQGLSAPVARGEMIESLLRVLMVFASATGSYLLCSAALKIGWGITGVLIDSGIEGTWGSIAVLLAGELVGTVVGMATTGVVGLLFFYVFAFTLILALMLLSAFALSYFAILTISVFLMAVAPLVIVIGELPQFRWLYGLWVKIGLGILLIPLVNAVLLRAWSLMSFNLDLGAIVKAIVNLGFVGLIVGINYTIGTKVFAPVLQAGRMAWDSTKALGKALVFIGAVAASGGSASALGAGEVSAGVGASQATGTAGVLSAKTGGFGYARSVSLDPGVLTRGIGQGVLGSPAKASVKTLALLSGRTSGEDGRVETLAGLAKAGQLGASLFARESVLGAASSSLLGAAGRASGAEASWGQHQLADAGFSSPKMLQTYLGGDPDQIANPKTRFKVQKHAGDLLTALDDFDRFQMPFTKQSLHAQLPEGLASHVFAASLMSAAASPDLILSAGEQASWGLSPPSWYESAQNRQTVITGSPSTPAAILAATFDSIDQLVTAEGQSLLAAAMAAAEKQVQIQFGGQND
jgi:hypothetical protein